MRNLVKYLITILFAMFILLLPLSSYNVNATTNTLVGKLSITYSSTSGKLSAIYTGNQTLSGAEVYTWYKDGSTKTTGKDYAPTEAGVYYCVLKDSNNYEGTLTSTSITLYRATGQSITFDNTYGLYQAGDTVNVSATLTNGQTVTNWKTSANGVAIPETGQTVSFRMPPQSLTVTATIKQKYTISVNGGTADKYEAYSGETVTIRASQISGKQFVSWTATGGKLGDANSQTSTITVAYSDITVTANFNGVTESSSAPAPTGPAYGTSYNGKADAKHAVFQVLQNNGYSVQVAHHDQGPLCVAAFKANQGRDWLVTDYFNITVNNSFSTYEITSPIQIQLTIPDDLILAGRHWRMLCVSRNGTVYSFPDEDLNDSTITFSPDKFFAYAMLYNDIVETVEEPIPEIEPVDEVPIQPVDTSSSSLQSADSSRTTSSTLQSADTSETTSGAYGVIGEPNKARLKSDQKAALRQADGATVSFINM